jgi:Tol biopolymer transport system component
VIGLLGSGGMGEVYRARDSRLSREVALKVVHAGLAQDPERLRRFEQEAKAAGSLNHPNIVAVYDTGEAGGAPYIVSELLQGETLRERLAAGRLGVRKAVELGVQIAKGLAAAHDKGIVHRDLKPENLFLTKDGLVKILDFGIAKLGRREEQNAGTEVETESQTQAGTQLGTVGYMAPEQVRALPADQRSDLFSFGAVLFEMLTGRRAFKGATAADTMSAILREDPTEPAQAARDLPEGLLRVVRRCLEKSPDDRFQGARDLAFALESASSETRQSPPGGQPEAKRRVAPRTALVVAAVLAAAALSAWLARRSVLAGRVPSYERLTYRVGAVGSARFAPDGETIVYGAQWGSSPREIFLARAGAANSRPLGLKDADILAISSREELAIQLRPKIVTFCSTEGTLARVGMAGGAPRELLEGVLSADWSPDGKDLAVVHAVGDRYRIEYPIGHVLYQPNPPAWLSHGSVSPDGRLVAFVEHPIPADERGELAIVGPGTPKRDLASAAASLCSPRWTADGGELWYSASDAGSPQQIRAVSLAGQQRVVVEHAGPADFKDRSRSGRALFTRGGSWTEVRARARGSAEEAELAAADLSYLADLSDDGRLVLGTDIGGGSGPNFSFYVQKTDGSAPVWLGEGDGQALSPDGRLVLALLQHAKPQQLVITPTGAGETRVLEPGPITSYARAVWHPAGTGIVIAGSDASATPRLYFQSSDGGPPRAFSADGVTLAPIGRAVSPDGKRVVALDPDGVPELYPLAGGRSTPVPGLDVTDAPLAWTPDGRELIVARYEDRDSPQRVERVDVATGKTRPWHGLGRALPTLFGESRLLVTPDGESYAYGYTRRMNDLYLSSPLR